MAELNVALEEAVRASRPRVVAQLVRELGSIDAAEEAFQEAALAALAAWPKSGVPQTPGAWLTTAARNHGRDSERHRRVAEAHAPPPPPDASIPDTVESIADDLLRLIFTCCHPALSPDSQVALTLKLVAGLSTEEIARAFISSEATVAQRLVRAKRTLEEKRLPYEVPGRAELPERLPAVLAVVYLVFNEGHVASTGGPLRVDLQGTALRLARSLCDLLPEQPRVFSLFALLSFGAARASSRVEAAGELVLLERQDRTRWDRGLIMDGLVALGRARRLGSRDGYLLQAELAAHHVLAPSWDATDWRAILRIYDELRAVDPSPVVALNRAVAVGMLEGPAAGLAELNPLEVALGEYHLFFATRADLRRQLGQDAAGDLRRALELTQNDGERRLLERKLRESR